MATVCDAEAERCLLGSLLLDPDRLPEVQKLVQAPDFAKGKHKDIFEALEKVRASGLAWDIGLVNDALQGSDANALDLTQMMDEVATAANVLHYAEKVRLATRRWKLADLGAKLQSIDADTDIDKTVSDAKAALSADGKAKPAIVSWRELAAENPELDPPVIDGLLRVGETCNVIAASKRGKSWLIHSLALDVATGNSWLSWQCSKGRVLLVDNELKPAVLVRRLQRLAEAMEIDPSCAMDAIDILPLRGRVADLNGLGSMFLNSPKGKYALVVLDAWYRTLPMGVDENSNADVARLYNRLDGYAETMGAAFVAIHHASKGNQAGKAVTDVGSGAGAMSRATDTHVVIRDHEEDGAVVLEAAVRSWPPVNPICLRWSFPLWRLAPDLDPKKLRVDRARKPKAEEEKAQDGPAYDASKFVQQFVEFEPRSKASIYEQAELEGLSRRRIDRLIELAIDAGIAFPWSMGNEKRPGLARKPQPPSPLEAFLSEHPDMPTKAIADKFGVGTAWVRKLRARSA